VGLYGPNRKQILGKLPILQILLKNSVEITHLTNIFCTFLFIQQMCNFMAEPRDTFSVGYNHKTGYDEAFPFLRQCFQTAIKVRK